MISQCRRCKKAHTARDRRMEIRGPRALRTPYLFINSADKSREFSDEIVIQI